MDDEVSNSYLSIQLENWLEKRSRSHPKRWLKRYFRFNGIKLSYSRSESTNKNEKCCMKITDIREVKMQIDDGGKSVLVITNTAPIDNKITNDNNQENNLELCMPNNQILKIWFNAINDCLKNMNENKNNEVELKAKSCSTLNNTNDDLKNKNERQYNSTNNIISNNNSGPMNPLPQPNIINYGINLNIYLY